MPVTNTLDYGTQLKSFEENQVLWIQPLGSKILNRTKLVCFALTDTKMQNNTRNRLASDKHSRLWNPIKKFWRKSSVVNTAPRM
jgi:hypothetical protein